MHRGHLKRKPIANTTSPKNFSLKAQSSSNCNQVFAPKVKKKKKILYWRNMFKKIRVHRLGFFFSEISVCKNTDHKQYPQVKVNINCTINHHFESFLLRLNKSSQFSRSTASNRMILLWLFFSCKKRKRKEKKKEKSLGLGLILG